MSLMTVSDVAKFLGVQEARVTRLERERLLVSVPDSDPDKPMFDQDAVAKYKELAERLGGL